MLEALRARLRPLLAGLTTRGRSFISAGAASALCAFVLGQEDLLRIAVLLAALPIGCSVMLSRAQYRISLHRTVEPARAPVGTPVRVRLEMQNVSRVATRVLLAEDAVPFALGTAPRFVLDRLPGGQNAAVTYTLRSPVRGRFSVGPLRLRVADPFGMCELSRSFTTTHLITIVPRVYPLTAVRGGGSWGGAGESMARSVSVSGEDDASTREYHEGDDLRRVHWRSTAKRGELMVRREEQPRQLRVNLLLDRRHDGHRGEGAASSFEWAASMAASVAMHFAGLQHGVRIITDGEPVPWTTAHHDEAALLLDRLAVVATGPETVLDDALEQVRRSRSDAMTVAVLGEIGADVATTLAGLGRDGFPGVVVLIRTAGWAAESGHRASRLTGDGRTATDVLRAAGWLVVEARHGMTPTQVWSKLTETGSMTPTAVNS